LGFPAPEASDAARKVLVTLVGGGLVGLVADRMRAILWADPRRIDPAPPMLAARAGGECKITAIYRGESGLVSVLAPDQLFREDVMRRLGQASAGVVTSVVASARTRDDLPFLVFRLGDEEFALPIAAIDEVARVPDRITRVPKTPNFLEGVINLRGEVLPVVDQRRRFDLPPFAGGASRRLIVARAGRHRAGLIVDSVSEVMRVSAGAIEPPPNLTHDGTALIDGVINAGERMILLLNPAELLTRAERGVLDDLDLSVAGQASA
jgi:purine-binding chemotaxis protein CheW